MRSIIAIRESLNPDELTLRADIEERRAMIGTMVGSLYPSILQGEIDEIKDMITNLKYSNHPHEFYGEGDFTQEEIERHNVLAVAALIDKRKICKRCGYEETVL